LQFTDGRIYLASNTSITYGIDIRGSSATGASLIGWVPPLTTYYGLVGASLSGSAYSFYGTIGAYLSAGAWTVSDGDLKSITGDLDPTKALNAVNAIAVKRYDAVSPEARNYLYGVDNDEPLFGWIAQEVEALIPTAVRDVGIPKEDLLARSALRRCRMPERDTPEAEALGEADMSVKAINDRYMLTTLWAAVQALSARVAELEAGGA